MAVILPLLKRLNTMQKRPFTVMLRRFTVVHFDRPGLVLERIIFFILGSILFLIPRTILSLFSGRILLLVVEEFYDSEGS
ncbi:unnamed protein product [Rotaria magnacalcarata]|uniref:Uncharacterized protein n=1 Tax=Rotaria magnacalcarata TaxID=392030 RepID=A0A8S3F087_9BILA|nr:unnamed protein product [Rotaria magnacalcarata]